MRDRVIMKIVTWNINGIRAGNNRSPLQKLLDSLDSDIICVQETKVTRDQLDDATANIDGYNSYFSFSKKRSGYSGVATYCRDSATPVHAEEGLSNVFDPSSKDDVIGCYGDTSEFTLEELQSLDGEGRAIMTEHICRCKDGSEKRLVVINVYCPRADYDNEERMTYKLQFYKLLQRRAEALLESKKHVIIVGDINCSHKKIDHCDPSSDQEKYRSNPARQWMNDIIRNINKNTKTVTDETESVPNQAEGVSEEKKNETEENCVNSEEKTEESDEQTALSQEPSQEPEEVFKDTKGMPENKPPPPQKRDDQPFVDTFRYCYPKQKKAFTCWSSLTSARETNYGTRIDYIFADVEFSLSELKDCLLLTDVYGSDHCPVRAEFLSGLVAHEKCPGLCVKYMPEFAGRQKRLSSFFRKLAPGEELSFENIVRRDKEREGDGASKKRPNGNTEQSGSKKMKTDSKTKPENIKSFFKSKEEKSSKEKKKSKKSKNSKNGRQKKESREKESDEEDDKECSTAEKKTKDLVKYSQFVSAKVVASETITGFAEIQKKEDVPMEMLEAEADPVQEVKSEFVDTENLDGRETELGSQGKTDADLGEKKMDVGSQFKEDSESESKSKDSSQNEESGSQEDGTTGKKKLTNSWKNILKGPPPPPLCKGHKEKCVLRTVKKPGPNQGKQFFVCNRPEGHRKNPKARCNHFEWVKEKR